MKGALNHEVVSRWQRSADVSLQGDTELILREGVAHLEGHALVDVCSIKNGQQNIAPVDRLKVRFEYAVLGGFGTLALGNAIDQESAFFLRKVHIDMFFKLPCHKGVELALSGIKQGCGKKDGPSHE
jgi:hypothetical protein